MSHATSNVMQRTHDMLASIVLGFLVIDMCYGENKTYVYVQENKTVTLPCNPNVLVWWGPINFTVYASGGDIDPNLPKHKRLSVNFNENTNTSELQIQHFSKEDEGLYRCSFSVNGNYNMPVLNVLIKKNPKNITISGTDKNKNLLFAQSDQILNLTCYVESGIPKETMIWRRNTKELIRGGPSSLTYTFTPNRTDHMQNFSCLVQTDSISLEKKFKLFLYFLPSVQILPGKFVSVVEGTSVNLRCNFTSNHKIKEIIWQYDNKYLTNSSELHLVSIKRNKSGDYSCTVVNEAGKGAANVTIEVLYPPDVTVSFSDIDETRELKCNPDGLPNKYHFGYWEHKSELREHIRFISSTRNGTITIQNITNETNRHYDRGIYICNVSNNISVNDRTFMSAEYWLNSTGKPYFVTSNSGTQYGIINQIAVLTADIVTFENLHDAALFSEKTEILNYISINQSTVIVKDTMYGNNIKVHGTRLMFPLFIKTPDYFRQYTAVVSNSKGSSRYDIRLISASRPAPPTLIRFMSKQTGIQVSWIPGFNGGYPQTFYVQYRRIDDTNWETHNVSNGKQNTTTTLVSNLEPGTEYFIRMFARNEINGSNYTRQYTVQTENETSPGLIAAFSMIAIAVIAISFITYQYKTGNLTDIRNMRCFNFIQVIRAGDIGGVENDMYEMQNNIQQQQQHELGPENPEVPVYSSIDRRQHLSIGSAVSYSVTKNKKPNPLGCRMQQKGEHKKTNMAGMSTPKTNDNEELNYIEVCFDKKPQHPFKIHGLEERSDYVEIDFTKTVDRLPDCDKDDVSDDDFVSLEDVKSMKRKTQFTN